RIPKTRMASHFEQLCELRRIQLTYTPLIASKMKKNRIIFWVATTIIILWEGIMPLSTLFFAPEQSTVGTRPLGYPDYFAYALIICKALGVLAISFPRVPAKLREWA